MPNARWEGITLPLYNASITNPADPAYGFAVAFDPPTDPAPKTEGQYMLVFTGQLGEENADASTGGIGAVAAKWISITSGFVVTPKYTVADGVAGMRLISGSPNAWRLDAAAGVVAGNVDWKGAYVNRKANKVLSWKGYSARYFSADPRDP